MIEERNDMTFFELLQLLRSSWMLIAGSALAAAILAAVVAFRMTPLYRAEALLAPAASDSQSGSGLARLAGQFAPLAQLVAGADKGNGLESKDVRIATLRSRRLTESFIKDRNLLPLLFPKQWDAAAKAWKMKDGRPWAPSMWDGVRKFDDAVRKVTEDRQTGLVTLSIEWREPQVAAEWANDLVARANEILRARAIDESRRSIAFLDGELQNTTVLERRQIIYRLIESRTGEIMMANARKEFAFLVVDPASVPDLDDFARPKRFMMIVTGFGLGLVLSALFVCIRGASRRTRVLRREDEYVSP
jgi:uncharacterized protein involved in exopolysaccharide biosynthesis